MTLYIIAPKKNDVFSVLTPEECGGGGRGAMAGVVSSGTPALPLVCWRDLMREFMYTTAAERERREGGWREGERERGGRGGEQGRCTERDGESVCVYTSRERTC